ncbi:hypothetical protein EW026_g6732 [Hermanssonia centrifuga]|uniref:Enoyl reductase (ER) domain-containing protein n=1 Tax=Hermanssonia centrifuga TaxID=98765 RepID=A0A4S4KA37_9APHY|nr:hypothetical protein EW026_g6732 [Hermanssonia centrifuga]
MSHPNSYIAYRFEELGGQLKRAEIAWKDPEEGQIVAKVLACGVCASDEVVKYQGIPTGFPRIPGHEIVGEIVAVGPKEEIYKVGQRVGSGWHGGHCHKCSHCSSGDFIMCDKEDINGVFRDGGYAEYVTLRSEAITLVPEDMDPAEVAPLLCAGITTFNSLRNMDVRPPDVVAVQGIGGLGHLALQFSRAMGYRTVALSSSDAKRDLALKLGAQEYIDGSKVDQAKALQDLGGAKVIICTAPSPKVIQALLPALAVGGQLLILAISHESSEINLSSLINRRTSIRGWPSGTAVDSGETITFSKIHGVKCLVEKFPLDKAQEAYDHRAKARFRAVITP